MAVIIQSVQLYIKPVYSTAVHKTSLHVTVQLYAKPVCSTAVHKTIYSIGALKTSLQHRFGCIKSQQVYRNL